MNTPFDAQIEAAHARLEALQQRVTKFASKPDEALLKLVNTALTELSVSLEELHILQEELRGQNEELLATRAQLEQERQRYQMLFAFAPDGYLVTDAAGVIYEANRAASILLGMRPDFLVGKPLALFVPAEEKGTFYAQLERLRAENASPPMLWELRLQPRGGTPFHAAITTACLPETLDKRMRVYWLVRDISARVAAEQALQESEQKYRALAEHLDARVQAQVRALEQEHAKVIHAGKLAALGELATGLAHELRQPLTTILLAADYLEGIAENQKAHPGRVPENFGDEVLDIARSIQASVNRSQHLINHVRNYGRLSKEDHRRVDLNQTLEDSFMLIHKRLEHRAVQVTQHLSPDLPFLKGDAYRLEQVFINLISNAEHAMTEMARRVKAGEVSQPDYEKLLTIVTYAEADTVVAEVHDNGCGIPEEIQARIFTPFFTTKDVGEGTGLGLSISKDIVEAHGGEITFNSVENEGTTFVLRFPAVDV